ncbi:hypothetical protein TKK_0008503 [Trichogramma kaykai]
MNSMIIRCQISVFEDTSIDFDIKDHELINRLTFDSLFLSDELKIKQIDDPDILIDLMQSMKKSQKIS